jgi:hypothetical protein
MGYNIIGASIKEELYKNNLIHISCKYAYQPYFKQSFKKDITEFNGWLCENDIVEFAQGIDNFIRLLEDGLKVPMFVGYTANIAPENFIGELKNLRQLIIDRKVKYLSIS